MPRGVARLSLAAVLVLALGIATAPRAADAPPAVLDALFAGARRVGAARSG